MHADDRPTLRITDHRQRLVRRLSQELVVLIPADVPVIFESREIWSKSWDRKRREHTYDEIGYTCNILFAFNKQYAYKAAHAVESRLVTLSLFSPALATQPEMRPDFL